MAEEVNITMRLRGAREVSREANRAAGSVDKIGKSGLAAGTVLKRGFGLAAVGATAGAYGLAKAAGYVAKSFVESDKAAKATENAIRSSGGAANVSAKHVAKLAGALSINTGVDDEAIQSGQNLLLSFKNVRNEAGKNNKIFDQATKTGLDMAAAYGIDSRQAFIQLGKALQDPVKGAQALKRTGAIDQKSLDRLKEMDKRGASLIAQQKFVLKSINKSGVQGRAEAIAQPFDRLRNAVENIAETIGAHFAPAVNRMLTSLARSLEGVLSGRGQFAAFIRQVMPLARAYFAALGVEVRKLVAAIGPLAKQLFPAFKIAVAVSALAVLGFIRVVRSAVGGLTLMIRIGNATRQAIVAAFTAIVSTVASMPGRISRAAHGMWDGIKSSFRSAINWIIGRWNALSFHIGGGKIFGKKLPGLTLNTPNIPMLATGGVVQGAGSAMVGEAGPELLTLPRGARVDPLPRSGGVTALAGGAINVHSTIMLDGREVARSTARHVAAARNRR